MSSIQVPIAKRRGSHAARLLALLAGATMLAGCVTTNQDVVVGPTPSDYRQRHPIGHQGRAAHGRAVHRQQARHATPAQRADVLRLRARMAARGERRHPHRLAGRHRATQHAAAGAMHEVRAILAAAGVPANGVAVRPYRPRDPLKLATLRISYPRIAAEAGPCGLWPDDLGPTYRARAQGKPRILESRLRLAAQSRRHGGEPADLVQPRGETPPYTGRRTTVLDKYQRGESTAAINPDAGKGKISDVGQ